MICNLPAATGLVLLLVSAALPGPEQQPVSVQQQSAQTAQTSSPQRSEADKALSDILRPPGGGRPDPSKTVAALEKFLHDHPDYPRIQSVYVSLPANVYAMEPAEPRKALRIAEDAEKRFPEPHESIRALIARARFRAWQQLGDEGQTRNLARQAFEEETNPWTLRTAAEAVGPFDRALEAKLLEKALMELQKTPNPTPLALTTLRQALARSLQAAGRTDAALAVRASGLEDMKRSLAVIEALPRDDPRHGSLDSMRRSAGSTCQQLADSVMAAGDYDKALEYLAEAEKLAGENGLEMRPMLEQRRVEIYTKMGKTDLALESLARLYAAKMDTATRERIVEMAAKVGKKPEEVFAHARDIRAASAVAMKPFDLRTDDGKTFAFEAVRSKVLLVNFFFPT